jgi:hypothetical protein
VEKLDATGIVAHESHSQASHLRRSAITLALDAASLGDVQIRRWSTDAVITPSVLGHSSHVES